MSQSAFDPARHRWRKVTVPDGLASYKIHHDYTILGHDREGGTLDMVVRWYADGGHCPIHRHVGTTTILVLEGEQHLRDVLPDGRLGDARVRRAGDYHLSTGDVHPHLECGGPDGAIVFFGCHAKGDGALYEILDEQGQVVNVTTVASLIEDWQASA